MPILQLLALILFWIVVIDLFLVLNIYLGTLLVRWYQARRAQKEQK